VTENTQAENPQTGEETAKSMVIQLISHAGMSATDISEALGQRVSRRTIYRWAKGESEPQQVSDLTELSKLYKQKCSA